MLHPALTRVLAVVLAILCIILFLVSYFGLNDADELFQDDVAAHKKLTERIATYEQLSEKLEELEEYKKANEKLTEQEEEHDSTASQHRTDLATHTAKESGYKQGADALWEAKAKLEEQEIVYKAGVAEFNKQAAQFEQLKTMVQGMAALAEGCSQAAQLPAVADPGPAPAQPQAPAAPVEPIVPSQPEAFTQIQPQPEDFGEDEQAYQQALAAYNQTRAEYDAKVAAYNQAKAEYDAYPTKYADYEAALLTFNTVTLPTYEAAMAEYAPKAQAYQTYTATVNGLLQQGAAALGALGMPAPGDLAAMAQTLQMAYNATLPQVEEGEKQLAVAKAGVDEAGKLLEQGKWAIQGQLENIWWEMGKLDNEAVELAEEKQELTDNSAQLEKERELLEQQKQDENKLRSTRILLMQNQAIEDRVNAGGELVEISKLYADEFKAEYEMRYVLRHFLCYLGMAAAVGILVLPAAYEKIRSRLLLLVPAFLSLLFATAAELLSVRTGEGQFYTAVPVIIFAFLYILAAIGKKKVIKS